jgi:hypothetical protein
VTSIKLPFVVTTVILLLLGAGGCGSGGGNSKTVGPVYNFSGPPRPRMGSYPTPTGLTTYLGPDIGPHGYGFIMGEGDGIVYTCRAGHIDLIHLRISADWTAYLASKTFKTLTAAKEGFSYKLAADHTTYHVKFSYPENWKNLSKQQKESIAAEVCVPVGQYLTFNTTSWHEMLTWFGYKSLLIFPEFPSAFSWEESYSNLLGTIVAGQAMQDSSHTYNKAIAIALDNEMRKLGIQSADVARNAAESVRGTWFIKDKPFITDMRRRNFDIGLYDGMVTPTLVPNVPQCQDAEPLSYPVPNIDILSKYGITMKVEITAKELEAIKMRNVAFGGSKQGPLTFEHFAPVMAYIEKDAAERGFICDFNGR